MAGRRLAVLGWPVAHSRSPQMQNAALAERGLEQWSYEAIAVEPDRFEGVVAELVDPASGFVGVNVTIPHKEAALAVADEASDRARAIGAANTLSFRAGRIAADNTDAPGLIAALGGDAGGLCAIVLGAGGAARAACWALRDVGAEVRVRNRTLERAESLAADLEVEVIDPGAPLPLEGCDVLVNATSVGLQASTHPAQQLKALAIEADLVGDRLVVVEMAYGSTETGLVQVAKARGATVVDGLEILVRQGAEAFEIWTGLEAPLTTMRRAVRRRST
jgi:shikimate dehydrogenase